MTTKQEQDRRNFVHTVEVLFASAMAQRDLTAASMAHAATIDRSSWRRRPYALAAAGFALLILVPPILWLSGRGGSPLQQQAMGDKPAADIKTLKVQVRPLEKHEERAVQYAPGREENRALQPIAQPSTASTAERMAEARRVEEVLAQAARQVSNGDVAGARDILAAVEDGTQGPVTFALAETYDPNMLATWGTRGISSDVVKAEALYRRAQELGIARAHARIEALDGLTSTGLAAMRAQQPLALNVAPQLRGEPASRVRLPIEIRLPDAIQKNSFVRIRGLPPAAALSEGHAIAPGAWAVPLVALPRLTIILPAGVQGQADVAISLVNIDGGLLAEARTLLVVAAPPVQAAPVVAMVPRASAPVQIAPTPLPPAERERALNLHDKGKEQLERGNIFAARQFFERAAEIGLAQSAVALAATYDPDELAKLNVAGLEPDVEAARKWYKKAQELGAVEAVERLRRIGAR